MKFHLLMLIVWLLTDAVGHYGNNNTVGWMSAVVMAVLTAGYYFGVIKDK